MTAQPPPEWTPQLLAQQAYLRANWEEGVACPCCRQRVQLYKRRINRGMAEVLVAMVRHTIRTRIGPQHRPWIHVEHDLVEHGLAPRRARDFSLLRFWDLIERDDAFGPDSELRSGLWRVTAKGLWAVEHPQRELLASFVQVFNDRKRGESKARVSFASVLRRPFSFEQEVLQRAA